MPTVRRDGATLYYESIGDDSHPPVLMITGFGSQLIGWQPLLISELIACGLRLILLDNRHAGLSVAQVAEDDLGAYAEDATAVLDALGIDRAHVVAQSMGGIIALCLAATVPERILSLTLLYAIASRAFMPDGLDGIETQELTRAQAIEQAGVIARELASPGFAFDEDWHRDMAARLFDRQTTPDVALLHAGAWLRTPHHNWLPEARHLDVPVALIHGTADRLIDVRSTLDIFEAFDRAELHLYAGMGHEIPKQLAPEIVSIISRTVHRSNTESEQACQ